MTPSDAPEPDLALTAPDIYRAADEGILSRPDAERLVRWGYERAERGRDEATWPTGRERASGLNLVTVAYYFGAMLMITACGWLLGDKWEELGSPGIFAVTLAYATAAASLGWWVRGRGYPVAGGLLVTVAVCLVPLLAYAAEDMLGLWPRDRGPYERFYPWSHGSWIVMELATIAAAAVALRYVRFAFLTAPLAVAFWFLAQDLSALLLGRPELDWDERRIVSVAVGLVTILAGYWLDRGLGRHDAARSEDFAFWCYLFGMMAFWGGLTAMDSSSEVSRAVYAALNVGLIWLGTRIRRATFVVFGVVGVHLYLGHLAYSVFEDSVFFPFALALLGLSVILVTIWVQRRMRSAAA